LNKYYLILVEAAYFGGDDMIKKPVDRLVCVKHDEKLHQPRQFNALEHFPDETELAEFDDKPGLIVCNLVVGEFQHRVEESRLG